MAKIAELEEFRDLILRGPTDRRPALRQALIDRAVSPWSHAKARETDLAVHAGRNAEIIAFEREARDDVDAVGLLLWSRDEGFEVSNIVPLKVMELGRHRYNAALEDFILRVANPAANIAGYTVEVTAGRGKLDDWLEPDVAETLRGFSSCANKATGSSHPLDRERWFAFLLAVHRNPGSLDVDRLGRWLVEVEHWPDQEAQDLVIEYEFGLKLLDRYDHYRT